MRCEALLGRHERRAQPNSLAHSLPRSRAVCQSEHGGNLMLDCDIETRTDEITGRRADRLRDRRELDDASTL
jgi:hypothetical protein